MIRKRYELEVDGKVVLRLKPKQDKVKMQAASSYAYGGWEDTTLDREHVLELRDTLDQILMDWFCKDTPKTLCPVCEREYGGIVQVDLDKEKSYPMCAKCQEQPTMTICKTCFLEQLRRDTSKREFDLCKSGPVDNGGMDATTFIPCEVGMEHEDPDVAIYGQSGIETERTVPYCETLLCSNSPAFGSTFCAECERVMRRKQTSPEDTIEKARRTT